jgi:FAT domain
MVQQCSELEEIIEYKKLLLEINTITRNDASSLYPRSRSEMSNDDGEAEFGGSHHMLIMDARQKKTLLSEKWRKRIRGCLASGRAAIPVWKNLLSVRRMVLNEREDLDTWLEFASLCGQGGNYKLAEKILDMNSSMKDRLKYPLATLIESGNDVSEVSMDRRIQYAKLQQQWLSNTDRRAALKGLESLLRSMTGSAETNMTFSDAEVHRDCLLRLGKWKLQLLEAGAPVDPITRNEVLELFSQATVVDPENYRAWHEFGLSNFRAVEEARASIQSVSSSRGSTPGPNERMTSSVNSMAPMIINAAKGLLRASK